METYSLLREFADSWMLLFLFTFFVLTFLLFMAVVVAVRAVAVGPALQSRVEALTVLLHALGLAAVASPRRVPVCLRGARFGPVGVVCMVVAAHAGALSGALPPHREALAVHLHAVGLLAGTSRLLLAGCRLDRSGGWQGAGRLWLE